MDYSRQGTKRHLDQLTKKSRVRGNVVAVMLFKLAVLFLVVMIGTGAYGGYRFIKSIVEEGPDLSTINVAPEGYASTVYDINGKVIATLVQAGSNRKAAEYEDMPKDLLNAFIAIEDERFWSHDGIDLKGIIRAGFIGITTGSFSEGASTITQQLLKNNVFDGGAEKTFMERLERKIQEQYLALVLENRMSKEDIITHYLNTINLGSNTLGVQAAASRYFNKNISELNLSECAVIASITQNPSRYNPITNPENNKTRRDIVLGRMLEQGKISQEEYTEALADDVYSRIQNVNIEYASGSNIYSYFIDAVVEEVVADLIDLGYTQTQAYNYLYSGGLKIYATQDAKIQEVMDDEVNDPDNYPITRYSFTYALKVTTADGTIRTYTESDISAYKKEVHGASAFHLVFDTKEEIQQLVEEFKSYILHTGDSIETEYLDYTLQPQVSMVILDNETGEVRAISGGRGEKTNSLSLNRAIDSARQPGSCFKVLADFAPAIDTCGATLASTYYDSPIVVDGKNFQNWWGSDYVGYANIRQGIVYSMNLISVKCMVDTVTPELGYEYLENFGITTLVDNLQTDAGLFTDKVASLCLGGITYGVTNLEMTAAYASIANGGVYNSPIFYTTVEDSDGNVILESKQESRRVLKESTAFLLTYAMEDSFVNFTPWPELNITALGLNHEVGNMSAAAKSGSTTNNNDVWFEGYTPYYTCGIWGGYDDSISFGGGQVFHKNIWSYVMTRIHNGLEDPGFDTSEEIVTRTICSKSGLLAVEGVCDAETSNSVVYKEYFTRDTAPAKYCDRHVKMTVCSESKLLAGAYCPEENCEERVYLIINPLDNAEGVVTDDSQYTMPEDLYGSLCDIHTEDWETEETELVPLSEEEETSRSLPILSPTQQEE